jgi:hypothetical protein
MGRAFRWLVVLASVVPVQAEAVLAAVGESTGPPIRVRVTAPAVEAGRIVGHIVAVDERNVTIRAEGGETRVLPADAVTRIEVRRKTGGKGKALRIGALTGLAVGAAVGFAAGDDCGAPDAPSIVCIPRGASALGLGLVGCLAGVGVGAIAAPGERWEVVDYGYLTAGVTKPSAHQRSLGVYVALGF